GGATNLTATDNGDGTYTLSNSSLAVARYFRWGVIDGSFGGNDTGYYTANPTSGADMVTGVVAEPNGGVLAVGTINLVLGSTTADMLVMRLQRNGTPDNAFGPNGNGRVAVSFSSSPREDVGLGVVLQGDGRIVAVGASKAVDAGDVA